MNRFVNRELTVQELIYVLRAKMGDFEALILFMESRRSDPAFDIRSLPLSELQELGNEIKSSMEAVNIEADKLTKDWTM